MYGLHLVVETVRQMFKECSERRVEGANVALVRGNRGLLSGHVTAIIGSREAL
jgi:hypothetical protein